MTANLFRQQAQDNQTREENGSDPVRRRHFFPLLWIVPTALLVWALAALASFF